MSKKFVLLFSLLGWLNRYTVKAAEKDSIYNKQDKVLEEVVVTGARSQIDPRHLSQTISIVDRVKIEDGMSNSLLPLLSEQIPGVFVTSRGVMGYGVSTGAAGGISVRGLAGGSGRMLVLIDGHPQYAGIFGHPIADIYQSYWAERVEIIRGPASVLYGSNAMSGVINIVTKKHKKDGVYGHVHAGYGMYNTVEAEASTEIRHGKWWSAVGASYNRTDGHRANMEFEQYGGYARTGYQFDQHWNMHLDVNATHFNASYPGTVDVPLEDGDQEITRGMASLGVDNHYAYTSGGMSLFYNWGKHYINDGYIPSQNEQPLDSRFNSFDDMMGISVYQTANFFTGNRITAGFDWFRYGGKAWNSYVSEEKQGEKTELVNKHENEWAGYVEMRQEIGRWLTVNAGVRADYHSRVGLEWIPQGGVAAHLNHGIELKASASKGFRYPVLREMYMFPPQNPDLKAESMWNYEIAYSQHLTGIGLHYGINLFYIDGKNLIMTLPNPNGSGMLNQNSGKIDNAGCEAEVRYHINKAWSVEGNYSYLHMKYPVISAPEHKLYVGGGYKQGRWNVSTGVQYVNGLYISTEPVKKESFVLWNARASFRALEWLELWLKGDNLLCWKYEILDGYPMPLATVMGGVNIRF